MKPGTIHLPSASITSGQPVSSSGVADTSATMPSRMPSVPTWGALPVPSNHSPLRMITSKVMPATIQELVSTYNLLSHRLTAAPTACPTGARCGVSRTVESTRDEMGRPHRRRADHGAADHQGGAGLSGLLLLG